jgi:hypothetical protein
LSESRHWRSRSESKLCPHCRLWPSDLAVILCATAANGSKELILLKNSVFGKIREIYARTDRPTFCGEGFGPIGLLPLMCQLDAP